MKIMKGGIFLEQPFGRYCAASWCLGIPCQWSCWQVSGQLYFTDELTASGPVAVVWGTLPSHSDVLDKRVWALHARALRFKKHTSWRYRYTQKTSKRRSSSCHWPLRPSPMYLPDQVLRAVFQGNCSFFLKFRKRFSEKSSCPWNFCPQLHRIGGKIYTPMLRKGVPHKHLEGSLVYMYFPPFSLENKLLGIHQTSFLACWGTWVFRAENTFGVYFFPSDRIAQKKGREWGLGASTEKQKKP